MHDLGQALRMLRRAPAFAVAAVLVLTTGIGANVAIFSVVNAVLLKPLPFPESERLVQLVLSGEERSIVEGSPAEYMHWRQLDDVLTDVAAYRNMWLNLTGGDVPRRVRGSQVTEAYFRAFRAPFEIGGPFTARDDSPGAAKTAVISHAYWTRRLAGDVNVVGRALSLNGTAYTIVGVTAAGFDTREIGDIDVWVPYQLDPSTADQGQSLRVVARLAPGVSLEQARARLAASTAAYRARFPAAFRPNLVFDAVLLEDALVGTTVNDAAGVGTRTTLAMLLGAVALVLLIACANVAGLMLVRASRRQREIAVRSTLGAGPWRIARQFAVEGLILAAFAGVLGLALGWLGIRALLSIDTAGLPRVGEGGTMLGLDWRVAGFAVVMSLVTVVLAGLAPAVAASRTDPSTVLKQSHASRGGGFRLGKGRSLLIVTEVALAAVLLIGASLMIRTLASLYRVDPGFTVENVLVMRTSLDEPRFRAPGAAGQLAAETLERLRTIPGIEAATASCCVPLQQSFGTVFNIVGRNDEGRFTGGGDIAISTGDFFATFEIPVLRGRVFDERDDAAGRPVVVINRTLAARWWPNGQDPLEDRMLIGGGAALYPSLADEPAREVIGIVDDTRALRLSSDPRPIMYLPLAQFIDAWWTPDSGERSLAWIVRARSDPMRLAAAVQEEIRRTTGLPVTDVQAMGDVVAGSLSRQRANMLLMTAFGGVALLLAAVGVYGVVAYAVQQRRHEIGIRMALGAGRDKVRGLILRQGMQLAVIGTIVGVGAAFFLAQLLASALYGVQPRDPVVFAGVPLLLMLVAAAAVSIPALRASRLGPLDALRSD